MRLQGRKYDELNLRGKLPSNGVKIQTHCVPPPEWAPETDCSKRGGNEPSLAMAHLMGDLSKDKSF